MNSTITSYHSREYFSHYQYFFLEILIIMSFIEFENNRVHVLVQPTLKNNVSWMQLQFKHIINKLKWVVLMLSEKHIILQYNCGLDWLLFRCGNMCTNITGRRGIFSGKDQVIETL